MSQIVPATVSVANISGNNTGYWTFSYSAQPSGFILLGFSYEYDLYATTIGNLPAAGGIPATQTASLRASLNLSDCIPDDVECLVGGYHVARYRVNGSLSGSYSPPYFSGLSFSYGKILKAPVIVPANSDLQLVSKINAFWSSLDLIGGGYVGLCSLSPGTAKLVIG